MSGPSVVVKFLGDLKGLNASVDDTGKKADSVGKSAHAAFSGMLSTLNKTGVLGPFGAALDGVDQAIGALSEHGKTVGETMMGIGAGVAATGAVLTAFGSKEQASHQQLQAAIKGTGKDYEDYAAKIDTVIKKQENYGHTSAETQDALRQLTEATHDPAKALQLIGTASDLAAAKHESLGSAAGQLGKAYNGAGRIFKEFGITATNTANITKGLESSQKSAASADDALGKATQHLADVHAVLSGKTTLTAAEQIRLRDAETKVSDATAKARDAHTKLSTAQDAAKKAASGHNVAIDKLSKNLSGQAAAAHDTFMGKLDGMKAKLEDAASQFGQKYGPAITIAGTAMTGLGAVITTTKAISETFQATQKTQVAATEAVTAAQDAEAVSSWAALGPVLLIVAGIAALIAIAFVLYKYWDTIWSGIKTAVEFVWNWIKSNWPLLLGILLGPIAFAVAIIITHFDTVKKIVKDAVDFIKQIWNDLASFFSGVIARIEGIISGIWNGIKAGFNAEIDGVKAIWNGFYGWLTGLPASVGRAVSGMWDGLKHEFGNVIGAIARAWNSSLGAISVHVPSWVPGIGGKGFDVPNIPVPSLAQGGIITQTGLIFAHAGEAISPIPRGGLGPAVHIENANFATELDVDAFMRRAAWVAQTAGV